MLDLENLMDVDAGADPVILGGRFPQCSVADIVHIFYFYFIITPHLVN